MSAAMTTTGGFPRLPLIALGCMVAGTVVTVAAVRLTGVGAVHVVDAPAVASHEFRFQDRDDGSIAVLDADASSTGRVIEVVAPGTNGFLRGTMRGLARERHRRGIGEETPFVMVGRADGKLTLEDPATAGASTSARSDPPTPPCSPAS